MSNSELMCKLIKDRNDAMSIFHNSDNPLIQDFAFIDVQAAERKIAKLQEVECAKEGLLDKVDRGVVRVTRKKYVNGMGGDVDE